MDDNVIDARHLGKDIEKLIRTFQEKHKGLRVEKINFSQETTTEENDHGIPIRTGTDINVWLDVKLEN